MSEQKPSHERLFKRPLTRREVLRGAIAFGAAAAAGTGEAIATKREHHSKQKQTDTNVDTSDLDNSLIHTETGDETPEKEKNSPPLFEDAETQSIADEKKITAETFFNPKDTVPSNFHALQAEELFPIFHPRVMERKNQLYDWMDQYQIPVNVLAALMSIESGGDETKVSEANAVGLFQVVPEIHMKGLSKEEIMNPELNVKAALTHLVKCIQEAKDDLTEMNQTDYRGFDPNVIIRAFAIYNGGEGNVLGNEFKDLPTATQKYVRQTSRLLQVMEIAQVLRQNGSSNDEIVKKLCSREIDARAKIVELVNSPTDDPDHLENPFETEEELRQFLGQPTISPTDNEAINKLYTVYSDYKNGKTDPYSLPLNPALRIYTEAGPGFVVNDPINGVAKNYYHVETE